MTILIYFLKLIMNVIYCIFKLFPVKKKVIFISRQDNRPSINFNILIKALKKERADIEIVVSCKKLHKNFKGILSYIMHMLKEMYHLATSQVAILDTYSITISNLQHKNKLTVIQMWHAMGSLKKFGYSILNQGEGSKKRIAHVMNMHKNYDYVISSSKTCAPYFAEAFHVPIDKIFINA